MPIEFFPQPNIILQIGSIQLYFYGFMYAISAICGYFLLRFWSKKKQIEVSKENILDLVFWTFLGGVVGGRVFYSVVYNFDFFIANPLSIFAVWNGGMSIHGGLLGGAIAFYLFCSRKKLPLGNLADISVVAIALGLALGRLGNFVNGELPGRITDLSIGMDFGDGENRHPSQLYAVAKDLILFFSFSYILWKSDITKNAGSIFSYFLISYGMMRFAVEFFRAPDPQIGFVFSIFSMGQFLSTLVIIIGIISLVFIHHSVKNSTEKNK